MSAEVFQVLWAFFTAAPFVMAVAMGLALPLLLTAASQNFTIGLVLIGVAWTGELLAMGQPVLNLGISLHAADLPMLLVAAAALVRWLMADDMPRRHPAWVLLVLILVGGIAWGLASNGRAAGVQSRPEFHAFAAASYAMSFRAHADVVRRMLGLLLTLALVTVALCAYRWIVYYLPIPELLPPGGVYNNDGAMRVVPSNSALVVAQMLVPAMYFGVNRLRLSRWLSPVLLAVVLVLQHRSVWLAAVVGVLTGLMVVRAHRAPLWQQLLLALAVAGTTMVPIVYTDTLSSQLRSSAGRALAGRDTVDDRLQNWRSTVRQWAGDGAAAVAVGRVRGADARREVTDETGRTRIIEYQAHNHYVTMLTQFGVVGLAGFLWLTVLILQRLVAAVRRGDDRATEAGVLLILLAMQLTYYIAYGVDIVQFLLLGVMLSWVATHRPHPPVAAAPRGVDVAWR